MEDPSTGEQSPRTRSRRALFLLVAGAVLLIALGAKSYFLSVNQSLVFVPAPDRIGSNAPFIKSSDAVVEKMVEMAELTKDDVVYDLGCGDGRIVITAALRSGCRGVGFDIDPERVAEARENVRLHGVEDLVEIREQDIFKVDLSESTAVMFYLLPWMNKKLIPQFQDMKDGTRIISHDYGLGDDITQIPPDFTASVPFDDSEHFVHRWNVPLTLPE